METFAYATALQLAAAIRQRECTSAQVVQFHLDRIRARNPALNAIVTLDEAGALRRAAEADAALARGESWGPLHGVPYTIKDTLETEGLRTTAGFPGLASHVPKQDSTPAARLKAAGGVLLGKTNVPPLAMSLQTNNEVFGCTNNPWDVTRTVGGSSGGSAAAVAAGLVPFDVGSDMSGSIRIPAHYCGVFGLKPTANRLPASGHIPPLPGGIWPDRQLCTVGPLARSVEDLAFIAALLAGPDRRGTDVPPVPWVEAPRREPASLRIGFLPSFPGVPTSRVVKGAVERVARELAAAGAVVEQREPGVPISQISEVWGGYFPILSSTLMELAAPGLPVPAASTSPPTVANWARVQAQRDALVLAIDAFFDDFDAFLCPNVIATAFEHCPPRTPFPVDGERVESRFVDHYLYPFNMTGHPAVAIPAGLSPDDGLPVGVQLVGPRWGDERLLATARAVVSVIGGFQPPPDPA